MRAVSIFELWMAMDYFEGVHLIGGRSSGRRELDGPMFGLLLARRVGTAVVATDVDTELFRK